MTSKNKKPGGAKPRVKVETREQSSGDVVMEVSFHFPRRGVSIKARSLAEATAKLGKK